MSKSHKLILVVAFIITALLGTTSWANTIKTNSTNSRNSGLIEKSFRRCRENWRCTPWSTCTDGRQTRTCTDLNNCGTTRKKPFGNKRCFAKCIEDWQCTDWSSCTNGQQTRTCTDLNDCDTIINKPDEDQTCCVEDWQCTDWSSCKASQQTRVCTDLNACGTATNKPDEDQTCECIEDWQCTDWSSCTDGQQTRTCTDLNDCDTVVNKPSENQDCGKTGASYEGSPFGFLEIPSDNYDYYSGLGINWLEHSRENPRLGWESVEKIPGEYDFTLHDKALCDFYQQGMNVIYVTRPINSLYGTTWVEGKIEETNEYPDWHLDDWANFIKALVERYDGNGVDDTSCSSPVTVKYYQFVHELAPPEADYWQQHPDQYAEVFETTYTAMKEVCNDCILSMPIPNMDELEEQTNFFSDVLGYLEGKNFPDMGFDYHTWSVDRSKPRSEAWETRGENYWERIEYIERIKEIASNSGFNNSNIISLESGMAATQEMEYDQAAYVIRSYVSSIAHGQKKLFWTSLLEYSHYNNGLFAHSGLIHNSENNDGLSHKKLGYYTYKLMVEKLAGSDMNNVEIVEESDGVYIYKFSKNDEPIWVVWWDYFDESDYEEGDTITVTVDIGNINSAKITEVIPDAEDGSQLNAADYPNFFDTKTQTVSNGEIVITLGECPAFIEEEN